MTEQNGVEVGAQTRNPGLDTSPADREDRASDRPAFGVNWNANKDSSGLVLGMRDTYSIVKFGLRLEVLVDTDFNRDGREVRKFHFIRLDEARFADGRLVLGKNLYNRPAGDPRIFAYESHIMGRGEVFIEWPSLDEDLRDLGDTMIKMVHAEIAWNAREMASFREAAHAG